MRDTGWVMSCLFLLPLAASPPPVFAGRYESLTEWAAQGPKMEVRAATFFGSESPESFVDVAQITDGSIVAVGNAYGPAFPNSPKPVVLGKGTHTGAEVFYERKGKNRLKDYSPDMGGFLVFYAEDLSSVSRVVRFDWGVATFTAGCLSRDGKGLIVSGYCSPDKLAALAGTVRSHTQVDPPPEPGKKKRRLPDKGPGPAYVMRLSLAGLLGGETDIVDWCWTLQNYSGAPDVLWQDKAGNVCFALNGLTRIDAGAAKLTKITDKGTTGGQNGYRGLDPNDGGYFYGGDRNTNTGREPWRQPFLHKYNARGEKVWSLWGWDSKGLRDGQGTDDGLVSDSSIRKVTVADNGDLIVAGWSDGGNSVFTRQPYDVQQSAGKSAGPFTTWGMRSANSLGYVLRIDPKTFEQKSWSYWVCYVPESFESPRYRGAPNFASIKDLVTLPGDAIAIRGSAATGLISTPNAFYLHSSPGKYGGEFVAVMKSDFSGLLFSSYLPGYDSCRIAATRKGIAIVGTARKDDGREKPTPTPIVNALQPQLAGGEFDGHIVVIDMP